MPVLIRKKPQPDTAKTAELVKHVHNAAPPFKMSETEFLAMVASDRQILKDAIGRPTTAALLGITVRTLDRWHDQDYGPKRAKVRSLYLQQSRCRGVDCRAWSWQSPPTLVAQRTFSKLVQNLAR